MGVLLPRQRSFLPRRRTFRARMVVVATLTLALCFSYCGLPACLVDFALSGLLFGPGPHRVAGKANGRETFERLDMTTQECSAAFPGLTREIEVAVARGPFKLKKMPTYATGMVQGRIEDGKLYVISVDKQPVKAMKWERDAVLQQLHRALVTSPERLPNTTFAFSIVDSPRANGWSFSRSNSPDLDGENYWVMPHFSFWSWPLRFIGTMDEALGKIEAVEREVGSWDGKVDKAVWRGTAWFNSVGNTQLRPQLVQLSKGKEWADVETLNWETNGEKANNSIRVEDFCKYRYIIYTEGITYSGRLPFHQACESIILTPPPTYLMHTTHLMRPLLTSTLNFADPYTGSTVTADRWSSYPASEANIIFVAADWSDLEQTIAYLRTNPDIARGIARRQRQLVSDGGYLSPAAEACYWRALVRGWASVATTQGVEGWVEGEGVRFETFALRGELGWG